MEPQAYALIGVAVTSVLFMLGGAFALGKLFQRMDTLLTDLTRLTTEVRQLSADVRRTNEFVIALANRRQHDIA